MHDVNKGQSLPVMTELWNKHQYNRRLNSQFLILCCKFSLSRGWKHFTPTILDKNYLLNLFWETLLGFFIFLTNHGCQKQEPKNANMDCNFDSVDENQKNPLAKIAVKHCLNFLSVILCSWLSNNETFDCYVLAFFMVVCSSFA